MMTTTRFVTLYLAAIIAVGLLMWALAQLAVALFALCRWLGQKSPRIRALLPFPLQRPGEP